MQQRLKKGLAAAFAFSVLLFFMIHAGTSSGCSRSNAPSAAQATADSAATANPAASSEPAYDYEKDKAMHFPASKAGPISPRKGQ